MKLRVKCRVIGSLCIFLFLLLLVLLSLPSSASLCTILLFCGNTGNRTNPCIASEGSWDRAESPVSSTQGCCWVGLCPSGRAAKANKNQPLAPKWPAWSSPSGVQPRWRAASL